MLSELAHAPMTQHAGMKEILIDGRQLVLEHRVEMLEHLGIALHDRLRSFDALAERPLEGASSRLLGDEAYAR